MAVVPSISEVKNIVLKTLNWIKLGMVPVGTIQTGLYTAPPAGYLAFKRTDQILKSQYPALCDLLFKINGFKGNGSTYANIPNVDHRVIELASNVSEVGQLIEAGLPDITGYADFRPYGVDGNLSVKESGALRGEKVNPPFDTFGLMSHGSHGNKVNRVSIKASLASALYKGDTFQNNALRLLAIVKF